MLIARVVAPGEPMFRCHGCYSDGPGVLRFRFTREPATIEWTERLGEGCSQIHRGESGLTDIQIDLDVDERPPADWMPWAAERLNSHLAFRGWVDVRVEIAGGYLALVWE